MAVFDTVDGGTRVPLRLPPLGSAFVIFRDTAPARHVTSLSRDDRVLIPISSPAETDDAGVTVKADDELELHVREAGTYRIETAGGERQTLEVQADAPSYPVSGPWQVEFSEEWGGPASTEFDELISWIDHPDDGIKYYAGVATYRNAFRLPADVLGAEYRLALDLGTLHFVADVFLNDEHVQTLWKPPYTVDITGVASAGTNELVIEVANVWSNRLKRDAQLPREERLTNTNISEDRREHPPLLDSGLLGPVHVRTTCVYGV